MANLPLKWAAMKWKGRVINRLPIAIPLSFKGLYLVGKRKKINALPGIALALSVNRKLIGQRGEVESRSIKGRKDKE